VETGEAWEDLLEKFRGDLPEDEDPAMVDTFAEREARLEWIRQRWVGDRPCAICGNRSWLVSDPGPIGPQVDVYPVTCRYCGNTNLLEPRLVDLDAPVEE
jgi:hypothetical protein